MKTATNLLKAAVLLAAVLPVSCSPAPPASDNDEQVGSSSDPGQALALAAGHDLIGTPAPKLRLRSIDGGVVDLGALAGRRPVYLKFWATWCAPCREQMPHFERAYNELGDNLEVVAVNTGFNDDVAEIRRYRDALGLTMPMAMDDGGLAAALNLRVTPQHVVVDIAEAGAKGADVAAFGETWLPGYPFFVDAPLSDLWWEAAADYLANAIPVPGPETDALCAAAKAAGCDVVIGVAELDPATQASVYCTLVFISREGAILGRHRKLKPTHHERSVWSDGDAKGLVVHPRPYGRLSGLSCWEHNILLPGFALIAQGTQIHVAAWPGREPDAAPSDPVWARQLLLSRAFASQAGAYVIAAAGLRHLEHVPPKYRPLAANEHNGRSAIIDPRGEVIAQAGSEETVLIAEGSLAAVRKAKSACDPAGHYSRPDLFELRLGGRVIYPGA